MKHLTRLTIPSPLLIRQFTSALPNVEEKEQHKIAAVQTTQLLPSKGVETTTLDPFKPVDRTEHGFLTDVRPAAKKSFNFAAYVNQSKTLKQFIKLGVSLYDIENVYQKDAGYLTLLDFEKDCLKHIKFLRKNGLKDEMIGKFITIYPTIFKESIENLQIRLNFLEHMGFKKERISVILNLCPQILNQKTTLLENQLKQLQIEFSLNDIELIDLVTKDPEAILYPRDQFRLVKITLYDEFGFNKEEAISIIVKNPTVLKLPRPLLVKRLDLVHNVIGYPQELISRMPGIITGPKLDIRHRFAFLKKLNRNQVDCEAPRFVPPDALYKCGTEEFCSRYAKASLDDYIKFLKSM